MIDSITCSVDARIVIVSLVVAASPVDPNILDYRNSAQDAAGQVKETYVSECNDFGDCCN